MVQRSQLRLSSITVKSMILYRATRMNTTIRCHLAHLSNWRAQCHNDGIHEHIEFFADQLHALHHVIACAARPTERHNHQLESEPLQHHRHGYTKFLSERLT